MDNPSNLDEESSAVQKHLEIMQNVINRMAENSRSCKVWCVILVSAILALVALSGQPDHILIALAPAVLFYVLDAYYLSLERGFRNSYNNFVRRIHQRQATASELYTVAPDGSIPRGTLWAMSRSFSVPPFYAVVAGAALMARWLLV